MSQFSFQKVKSISDSDSEFEQEARKSIPKPNSKLSLKKKGAAQQGPEKKDKKNEKGPKFCKCTRSHGEYNSIKYVLTISFF